MIQNFITMNGYGLFVWLSFVITVFTCAIFYYKTRKTLKKYEKAYVKEIKRLSVPQRKLVLEKSEVATQLLASYNKSI
jgi:heme exporter protein D